MKIAVHGSYFGRNFGDTLLVKIICDWLKSDGHTDLVLPKVSSDLEAFEIGVRKINQDEWDKLDFVIFSGGGYFGEPSGNKISLIYWYIRNYFRHIYWLKKCPNAKIIILGVGFGPISNKVFLKKINSIFKSSEFIYFRDEVSIEYLKKYGIYQQKFKLGVDLAYSLGLEKKDDLKSFDFKIGIHIPIKNLNDKKFFLNALSFIKNSDFRVELICDTPQSSELINNSNSLYYELIKFENVSLVSYISPDELIRQILSYRVIITSKLHVGIVATNLGVPVYSIPKHSKTLRYYTQIGYESNCNPIYDFDYKKHENLISNLINLKPAYIPKDYYKLVEVMKSNLLSVINGL